MAHISLLVLPFSVIRCSSFFDSSCVSDSNSSDTFGFGFSFDLGGSAVSYLIEENTTITSIKTKIYTSQLQTPANLSPYSSIIYLITRYDYLKNLTPQQGELQLQQTIANMNRPMINAFNSPPLAMARTAPPVNPDRYYYTGYPTNQMETIEEEDDY